MQARSTGLNPVGTRQGMWIETDRRPPTLEGEPPRALDLFRKQWVSARAWDSCSPPSANLESKPAGVQGRSGKPIVSAMASASGAVLSANFGSVLWGGTGLQSLKAEFESLLTRELFTSRLKVGLQALNLEDLGARPSS